MAVRTPRSLPHLAAVSLAALCTATPGLAEIPGTPPQDAARAEDRAPAVPPLKEPEVLPKSGPMALVFPDRVRAENPEPLPGETDLVQAAEDDAAHLSSAEPETIPQTDEAEDTAAQREASATLEIVATDEFLPVSGPLLSALPLSAPVEVQLAEAESAPAPDASSEETANADQAPTASDAPQTFTDVLANAKQLLPFMVAAASSNSESEAGAQDAQQPAQPARLTLSGLPASIVAPLPEIVAASGPAPLSAPAEVTMAFNLSTNAASRETKIDIPFAEESLPASRPDYLSFGDLFALSGQVPAEVAKGAAGESWSSEDAHSQTDSSETGEATQEQTAEPTQSEEPEKEVALSLPQERPAPSASPTSIVPLELETAQGGPEIDLAELGARVAPRARPKDIAAKAAEAEEKAPDTAEPAKPLKLDVPLRRLAH